MLKNYVLIAIRHLKRNKVFSLVNLLGLSIGLATFFIIFIFVAYHHSFDRYHADTDRIVRVGMKIRLGGELISTPTVGAPGAGVFMEEIPEVEEATRIFSGQSYAFEIKNGDKSFGWEQGAYGDPNFFDVFSIPMIVGEGSLALSTPKSMVLTRSMVSKYFGESATPQSVIGELLDLGAIGPVQVAGVCADVPPNTHFKFKFLLSTDLNERDRQRFWMADGFYTYVKLSKKEDLPAFEEKLAGLTDKYIAPEINEFLGVSMAEFLGSGGSFEFTTMPVSDIHLWSHSERELAANMNGTYVAIFLGIGCLILVLAVINFVNLSAASNVQRLKEVGVRKVMGARRSALVLQFMAEALLITLVAFAIAVTLQQFLTPVISQYFGIDMGLESMPLSLYLSGGLIVSGLIGAAAGFYPALMLSTAKTTTALKGLTSSAAPKSRLSHVLIVVQFSITIALLSCVLVIMAQVHYLKTKPLGFDKDQIVLIRNVDKLGASKEAFRHELQKLPGVASVSMSGFVPSGPKEFDRNAMQDPTQENPETHRVTHTAVDEHFLATMGMTLVAGRNFSDEFGDEEGHVIINTAMAQNFGWDVAAGEPIGKTVVEVDHHQRFEVIGVVEDFHINNMTELISPFFFRYSADGFMAVVRFDALQLTETNASIDRLWSEFSNDAPIYKSYLDELFLQNFENEQKIGSLFELFTLLAIILSGMGLFAMTAFVTHQRTKEIGIRKVLGAQGRQLFLLLSKGVVVMLLIAAVLGIPVVYVGMDQWLQSYPYRISVPAWALSAPVVGMTLFVLLVSGWHILKVIAINPVESLRDE